MLIRVMATAMLVASTMVSAQVVGDTTVAAPPATAPVVTVVPAQPVALSAADKYKSEIVCRTSVQTGSLIAKHKVCLTRRQWSYVNDQTHDDAQRLIDDNRTKPAGN